MQQAKNVVNMNEPAPNYFTCTLSQAAAFDQARSVAKTVGDFLHYQAKYHPDLPAAAFPVPKEGEWDCEIFSMFSIHSVIHR